MESENNKYNFREVVVEVNSYHDVIRIYEFLIKIKNLVNTLDFEEGYFNAAKYFPYPNFLFIPLPFTQDELEGDVVMMTESDYTEEEMEELMEENIYDSNLCDGTYLEMTELSTLKNIILNGIKKPIIEYNKPKQLVYESLDILPIKKYRRVAYLLKNQQDSIDVQKISFENGIFWSGQRHGNIENNLLRYKYLIFNTVGDDSYLTYNSALPNQSLESYYGEENYLEVTDFKELERLFGKNDPIKMYNDPKQLVYEDLDLKPKYKHIVYKCKSTKDIIETENFIFKYNIFWGSDNEPQHYGDTIDSYKYMVINILSNNKLNLTYLNRSTDEQVLSYYKHDREDCIIVHTHLDILKNLGGFIDYNSPKQLVYESKKSDEYDCILCECLNDKEVIDIQKFAFENGYLWLGWDEPELIFDNILDCSIISFITTTPDNVKSLMRIESPQYGGWTMEQYKQNQISDGYKNIKCISGLEELKQLFGIYDNKKLYNEPKNLVYESLKSDEYDVILCQCNSNQEVIDIQNYAFEKGYTWNGNVGREIKFNNIVDCGIISFEKFTGRLRLSKVRDASIGGWTMEEFDEYYYNRSVLRVYNLNELKKAFGDFNSKMLYNEPKKLVYEKIIKFNNYVL